MGVVVFDRQFFINLDRPSIGISLDISTHALLAKKLKESHYDIYFVDFVRHQTSVPLLILSSVDPFTKCQTHFVKKARPYSIYTRFKVLQ